MWVAIVKEVEGVSNIAEIRDDRVKYVYLKKVREVINELPL